MKNSVCSFVLMLLCIVLAVTIAIFGINSWGIKSALDENAINKGLDLAGGLSITYDAYPLNEGDKVDLTKVEKIFRQRLDGLGYSEATITTSGDKTIRIEVPGIEDHEQAKDVLGKPAVLQFVNYMTGEVYFEGDLVASASADYGTQNIGASAHYVSLEFTDKGAELFGKATEEVAAQGEGNNFLDITLDGVVISHASVEKPIYDSSCIISGPDFTEESANELASLIDAGSLPARLDEKQAEFVEASLGSDALSTSIFAAAIGILLVMLFMIIVYRLPGFVSALALVGYVAMFVIIIVWGNINLSLPGIAGIILTIGMAVDANVIIYERIKEELNGGASVRSAVKAGFKGATSAIVDSNVTTIIAAVVLYLLGSGTVKGFGVTLLWGTVLSMFTALVVSRVLLTSLANMGVGSWLMGAKKNNKDAE